METFKNEAAVVLICEGIESNPNFQNNRFPLMIKRIFRNSKN